MRASPAEYNSAIRSGLNDALVWAEVLGLAGVVGRRAKLASCRLQVGAPRPAECKSALRASRRSNPASLLKKLICPMDGLRRLLHGERDARAPRALRFTKLFCYLCVSVVK